MGIYVAYRCSESFISRPCISSSFLEVMSSSRHFGPSRGESDDDNSWRNLDLTFSTLDPPNSTRLNFSSLQYDGIQDVIALKSKIQDALPRLHFGR